MVYNIVMIFLMKTRIFLLFKVKVLFSNIEVRFDRVVVGLPTFNTGDLNWVSSPSLMGYLGHFLQTQGVVTV